MRYPIRRGNVRSVELTADDTNPRGKWMEVRVRRQDGFVRCWHVCSPRLAALGAPRSGWPSPDEVIAALRSALPPEACEVLNAWLADSP